MIQLDDFVKGLKRENQYGDEATVTDEPTADIIRAINTYLKRVASAATWSWLLDLFEVNIVKDVQIVTLPATMKKVVAVVGGDGRRLRRISTKDALDWHSPASEEGVMGYYSPMGIDKVTGAKKIQVWGLPSLNVTLTAYGETAVEDLSVGDLGTGKDLLPFPDEILEVVAQFVSAKIQKLKKNENWYIEKKDAEADLQVLIRDTESEPADDDTTPPPAYIAKKMALRRGGRVA